tara:strand:- start:194 stop:529 length:336 start_codon:yes stop_codon:yes gene_type:complete
MRCKFCNSRDTTPIDKLITRCNECGKDLYKNVKQQPENANESSKEEPWYYTREDWKSLGKIFMFTPKDLWVFVNDIRILLIATVVVAGVIVSFWMRRPSFWNAIWRAISGE